MRFFDMLNAMDNESKKSDEASESEADRILRFENNSQLAIALMAFPDEPSPDGAILKWISHPEHPSAQFHAIIKACPKIKERIDSGDETALREVFSFMDFSPIEESPYFRYPSAQALRAILNARPDLKKRVDEGDEEAVNEALVFARP